MCVERPDTSYIMWVGVWLYSDCLRNDCVKVGTANLDSGRILSPEAASVPPVKDAASSPPGEQVFQASLKVSNL